MTEKQQKKNEKVGTLPMVNMAVNAFIIVILIYFFSSYSTKKGAKDLVEGVEKKLIEQVRGNEKNIGKLITNQGKLIQQNDKITITLYSSLKGIKQMADHIKYLHKTIGLKRNLKKFQKEYAEKQKTKKLVKSLLKESKGLIKVLKKLEEKRERRSKKKR